MEYCSKHDKVFREGETCLGCDTEKELKGPDDTLAEALGRDKLAESMSGETEEEQEHGRRKKR